MAMEMSLQNQNQNQNQNQLQAGSGGVWKKVMELTKSAQNQSTDPVAWAIQLSSILSSATVALPSAELAHLLVSHICWANHLPIAWKFLEKALAFKIVPPMLVLSLLSAKVIPFRHLHPLAYRLYMEFLKAYAFSLSVLVIGTNCPKIMKSIDDTLHLSQIYGLQLSEPGLLLVEFTISIVWQLLDASLDDEGLLVLAPEESSRWSIKLQDVEMDGEDCISEMGSEQREELSKTNTAMAIKIIGEFLQNKQTARILSLARQNMQMYWASFIYRLQLLTANSTILKNSKLINPEVLLHLASDRKKVLSAGKVKLRREFHAVMAYGSLFSPAGQSLGASCSDFWLPIDLFLEDAMDGSRVAVISAVERLTGLVKALKVVNETSWHNTFLGLWIAALRLVQRERDPSEGPVPRLDTCLCMLLSITTLAITHIVEEEEGELIKDAEVNQNAGKEEQVVGQRRKELVTSLQLLGDYEGLLIPPQSVSLMANQSAAKAIAHISGYAGGTGNDNDFSGSDVPMNCSGNMWHLIVEACIARNLLDTSAYFWPGYVNVRSNQAPCGVSGQVAGWSSAMKGCALTPAIVNVLVATPASSLAEIETIYEIALNGSDDEKIHAATILCGASLVRSWNIQEHIILFLTRLLSPSVPGDYFGSESYLMKCAPFLNVLLVGISSVDCLQIFSLHGLAPLLAGQLMPICEAFGSCTPNVSCTLNTEKELSCHVVFSNAFTLLLRLWRFDHLPIENCRGDMPPIGYRQSPEYLLSVRNSQLASFGNSPRDQLIIKRMSKLLHFHVDPIFLDSFPKLKSWYRQHQECIASTLPGLLPGSPCHQIVDTLLGIMFRKTNKSGQSLGATTTGSSNSSGSSTNDTSIKLRMPGWDILEATPFVLDAALTACAHDRLSPRELATGLKDLADFLPASLATIVSYFSAEVTRGIWKPAFMNGTDWPSPAANLSSVEQQIKKILDATGVDVPSLTVGNLSPATLPLPLAALISLTITYKLDKGSERLLTLTGPTVHSLSAGCPWPCMPIIVSLWAQKVKRWSDFLVFSASRTVFYHNSDAVVQLLKSCFTSALGTNTVSIDSNGGVGALLGHGFGSHCSGGMAPVAPGIYYLRVHRYVRDMLFITEEILSLLMLSVRDIVNNGYQKEKAEMVKKIKRERQYGQVSLSAAMTRVKLAASLGSSLVWISGGSNLVHSLLKETLPAWFLSKQIEDDSGEIGGVIAILRGYALAYFTILCGSFAWGVDSISPASKRREKILSTHLKFLASALDGKISLGCDWTMWQAYVTCFVSLMVSCTPRWVVDINVDVLKRLSRGLRQWNEEELALALLEKGGVNAISAAAQLIIECKF